LADDVKLEQPRIPTIRNHIIHAKNNEDHQTRKAYAGVPHSKLCPITMKKDLHRAMKHDSCTFIMTDWMLLKLYS
jgi:hypothetical protein